MHLPPFGSGIFTSWVGKTMPVLLATFLLSGCDGTRLELASAGRQTEAQALQAVVAGLTIDTSRFGSGMAAQALADADADLALVQNDIVLPAEQASRLRTIMPVAEEVLLILVRAEISASDLRELLHNRRIGVGPANSGTATLFKALTHHYGIDTTQVQWRYWPQHQLELGQDIDVRVKVTSLDDPEVRTLLAQQQAYLFSLDDPDYILEGSALEGFCVTHPLVRPYLLPRYTFTGAPSDPVKTVSVDIVLACRDDLPAETAYRLTEALVQNAAQLGSRSLAFRPELLASPQTRSLQFPLHEGSLQYLNRDRPTFWQNNAELIALLITILTLLYTAIQSIASRRRKIARDRMERHYAELLQLEAEMLAADDAQLPELYTELKDIRRQAMQELQAERLLADESFQIFLRLYDQARKQIEYRLNA